MTGKLPSGCPKTKGESNFEILKATIQALMKRKSDPRITSLRVRISQRQAEKAFRSPKMSYSGLEPNPQRPLQGEKRAQPTSSNFLRVTKGLLVLSHRSSKLIVSAGYRTGYQSLSPGGVERGILGFVVETHITHLIEVQVFT
jgi:hypothetical protein